MLILLGCYCTTFRVVTQSADYWWLWLTGCLAAWRVYEIICYEVLYHAHDDMPIQGRYAEIIRVLWHYMEIVFAFGIFYLIAVDQASDSFRSSRCDPPLHQEWINAAYFSLVTLATIGYGDYAPQTCLGKILISLEVLVGVFLLAVVLQRILSGRNAK
jgi:Ion channel